MDGACQRIRLLLIGGISGGYIWDGMEWPGEEGIRWSSTASPPASCSHIHAPSLIHSLTHSFTRCG